MTNVSARGAPLMSAPENSVMLKLPVPPSTNNLYFNTPHGRRKADGYRSWLNEAGWRLREQGVQPIHGETFGIHITAPLSRRRDLDNANKAVADLLVEMRIIPDDRLIDDWHIVRSSDGKEMTVNLWRLS